MSSLKSDLVSSGIVWTYWTCLEAEPHNEIYVMRMLAWLQEVARREDTQSRTSLGEDLQILERGANRR